MRHGKRGGGSVVFVLVWEDGEGDAFHGCVVPEGAHGPGPPPDLPEASFDGVRGPHPPAPVGRGVSETGGEAVGVVARAFDGLRVGSGHRAPASRPTEGRSPLSGQDE